MPNYLQIFSKVDGSARPFVEIDAKMCEHFKQVVDPDKYLCSWYTVIGTLIAVKGLSLGSRELRLAVVKWYKPCEILPVDESRIYIGQMIAILKWLEQNYTSDSWVQIGRR